MPTHSDHRPDPRIVRRLARSDTPTVANIIELLMIRDHAAGFAGHTITARYPDLPAVCGFAVTATFRSAYPPPEGGGYAGLAGLLEYALTLPEPRIMVIQDLDDPPRGVVYGEMIARSFRKLGCVGLITNGLGRDLHPVGALRFPCWTTGITASHAHLRIEQVGLPVTVAGLHVTPGDVLHADANGIVHIPDQAVPLVDQGIEPMLEAEQSVIEFDQRGEPTFAAWQAAWARKARDTAALKQRLLDLLHSTPGTD